MDLISKYQRLLQQGANKVLGGFNANAPQPIKTAVNNTVNFAKKNPNFVMNRLSSPLQLTPSDLPTLYGQQKIQIPRFDLQSRVNTGNNIRDNILKVGASIPEMVLNAPSDYQQGIGKIGQGKILQGVGQAGMGTFNMATLGGGSIVKDIGQNVVKGVGYPAMRMAIKQGAANGAIYGGGFGALSGLSSSNDLKEQLKQVAIQGGAGVVGGATLGGVVGFAGNRIGAFGAAKLSQEKSPWVPQLRDRQGRFVAGDTPVKPKGMPNSQWKFQLKFNEKYGRNPYEPVFPSTLEQALKLEVENKGVGLSIKDVSRDPFAQSTKSTQNQATMKAPLQKTAQGVGRTNQKGQLIPEDQLQPASVKSISQGAQAGIPKQFDFDPNEAKNFNSLSEWITSRVLKKTGKSQPDLDASLMKSQLAKLETEKLNIVARAKGYQGVDDLFNSVKGKSVPEAGLYDTPKTARVWIKSKFSKDGAYADMPVIRKEDNITLYQGSNVGDKRQFWTPDKKYASQFGEVKSKTGSFYQIDNGNRMTKVYVEAKPLDKIKAKQKFPNKTVQSITKDSGVGIELITQNTRHNPILPQSRVAQPMSKAQDSLRSQPISEAQKVQAKFLEDFNKTYNSGPATVKIESKLNKVVNKDKTASLDEMFNEIKKVPRSSKYYVSESGIVYDNATNKVLFDPAGKTTNEAIAFYKKLQSNVAQQPTVTAEINAGRKAIEEAKTTFPLQKAGSGVSQQAPQQVSNRANDLNAGQLLKGKQEANLPQSQVVSKVPTQQQLPKSGVNPSDDIISKSYNYNKLDQAYTESLDRFHPISKLGKAANKNEVIQNALTGHYGSGSIAKYHLDFELAPILRGGNVDDLRKAAIMQRDIELASRGIKGSGQNIKMKITPEIKASLDKLYKYQDDLVKEYLVKTGIMTEKSFNAMKANNQSYVPFKRVMDQVDEFLGIPQAKSVGSVGSQSVIKKIKGSDKEIVDPIESIIENTYKIIGLGQRQKVARAIVSLKKDLPEGMIKEYKGQSIGNNPVISLFENGKVKKYSVPREVEEAAKGLNEDQLGTLVKILSAPTKVFRASATTLNPEFMVPNVARDLQSAFVNVGLNPFKFASGVAHYIKKDKVYQEFLKSGGMTSFTSLDRKFFKESARELSGRGITIQKPSDLLRIIQNVGAISEQPTRIAAFQKVYNQALKSGKSVEEARSLGAYAAQEATVNFGRRGSKTQSLNAVFAFLNARMQGIDRTARSLKKDPVDAGTRLGLVVMAPGMATYAWNQQFPEYYDERIVSKNDKQNNFIIMLPSEGPGGAKFVKIPKGDIGKMFNPVEAFMDYAKGQDTDVRNAVMSMIKGFSPITNVGDLVPTALRPIVEDKANKNFFFDSPIVPEYQKDYEPGNQFRSFTPSVYRMIGDKANVSPARLQNLVEGYGTGWAKIGSNVAEKFIDNPEYKREDRGSAPINSTPIARRFLGGAKYSEEEEQQTNISRAKSIDYQINDVKSAIKRGGMSQERGIEKMNELMNEKNKAMQKVGGSSSSANNDINEYLANQELSGVKDRVKQSGKSETYNGVVYYRENGEVHSLKTKRPVSAPELTGNTILDKKLLSSYSSRISFRQNEVAKLYEQGHITAEQATKEIERLEAAKNTVKGGKKGKKVKAVKFPKIKIASPKKIKVARVNANQYKLKKVKMAKVKIRKVKVKA